MHFAFEGSWFYRIMRGNGVQKDPIMRSPHFWVHLPKKIHLFLDKQEDEDYIKSLPQEKQEKIKIIEIGKQPLYSDLFNYANTLLNEICMISNGDIWIQNTQIPFFFSLLNKNFIFALTRHEMDGKCYFAEDSIDSYDAFIFKSQLNPFLNKMVVHKQNIWGSENRVIDALIDLKYNVINPCLQFKIIHEHDMKRQNRIENNRERLSHKKNRIYFKKYVPQKFRLNQILKPN